MGRLGGVSFAAAGALAAAVGRRGAVVLDAADGHVAGTLAASGVAGASVSADGRRIAALTRGGEHLQVFTLPGARPLMPAGVGGGASVSLSAGGRRVATGNVLGGVAWDVGGTRPLVAPPPHGVTDTTTSDTGLSPDGRWLAVTSPDTGMDVTDLDNLRRVTLGRGRKLFDPVFSKDGGRIYTTVANGALWSYDRRTGASRQVLASREVGSRVSPHVSFTGFTTERFADRVAVVELASGSQVELLGPFRAGVRTAQIAPDGSRVVVLTKDGTLRVFGCPTCAPLPDLLAQARSRLARTP